METIRLGLIGLGFIGKVHLHNCLKLDSATIVAVSDVSDRALKLVRELGIKKTYTDYRKLLDDNTIDAVIIALPTHLHAPCAKEAAEKGKHILLEKPLARSVDEGKQIMSAVLRNNVKLMVGYPLRFSPDFQALKDQIESGELGEIQVAYATHIASGPFLQRSEGDIPRPVPEWWFEKELTGGGALIDLGCHTINLVRWYFGEVRSIKAYIGHRFNFNFEDHATCFASLSSGTKAIINVGWFSPQLTLEVEVFGTAGHAYACHSPSSRISRAIQNMLRKTPKYNLLHLTELSHFVECIKDDERPSPSGEEALEDLEAIEEAYENQIVLD